MRLIYFVLFLFGQHRCGNGTIFDEIQKLYHRQGIPFRENKFLDNLPILPEYDFIVVGSGPAGSAIANRLSEVDKWNILLLEAGLEGNVYNDIPVINEYTVLGDFSVNYDVEKQENACLGLVDKRCHWPSGNGVGGGSLINAMIYTRGHPSDYDRWAAEGNSGWSYKEVLPYFLKIENMSISELKGSEYHSTHGPVHIQYPFQTRLGKLFLKSGQDLGYKLIDYNNPNTMIGFSTTQTTIKGVRRESAASAYLHSAKYRPNLHIVKNAYVTKVLIDKTKTVRGVAFLKNGKNRTIKVKKEVIISAGAFGSPKLLMLSGIGPSDHLRKMGIPMIVDLPVGKNLQEHLGTAITFLINTTDSVTLPKLLRTIPNDFADWMRGKRGIFSSNIAEGLGYVQTKYEEDITRPDIELLFFATTIAGDGGLFWTKTRNISREIYKKTWENIFYKEGFTVAPMMMYPRSKGNVELRSRNPKDPIIIRANFLADPYDISVLREGAKIAVQLAETKAFQEIGAKLYTNPVYGCEQFKFNTDEYFECVIKFITVQLHHQCGTCKMGNESSSSVVDKRLRIHGLTGIRVADASIIPSIPGIHTMAPSYMIGEKAADMIKEDWGILE